MKKKKAPSMPSSKTALTPMRKHSSGESLKLSSKAGLELPDDFQLSEDFLRCFNTMENTRQNLYITGEAGTGKTTLLKYFRQNTKKNIVVLAPTGIAAINCCGQTIHSFFRFPPKFLQRENVKRVTSAQKIFNKLDLLIIDEASMMRADMMDAVDESLRLNLDNPNDAFGGVQVVLIGDLYQLPPIIDRQAKEVYAQLYETPYFFSSKIYQQAPFKQIALTKIYRQTEGDFMRVLNQIRNKNLAAPDLAVLNTRAASVSAVPALHEEECMTLTPTNAAAAAINETRLAKLKTESLTYSAMVTGEFEESAYPTEAELKLKVGAQVLLLQNDPAKRWVNGSVGEITALEEDFIEVKVEGKTHKVEPVRWRKIKYDFDPELDQITETEAGGFEQYPVKLAWAITIHKSQGLTFDRVVVDFGTGTFAHGQAYVALSRCRTLEGLVLKRPLRLSDIIFDPRVAKYHLAQNDDETILMDADTSTLPLSY